MNRLTSSRERIERVLAGDRPDRVPVSLWRHFPVDDQTPEGLAKATLEFQQRFQFDFIKVTPPSSFCLADWGVRDHWVGNTEGTREYIDRPVKKPEDWLKLQVLNPLQGRLGNQIKALKMILKGSSKSTPVLQTVFSPLAQAKNLVGPEELIVHLRKDPERVHEGLKTITQTTIQFIQEIQKTGADGIFYACQHARYNLLSRDEFYSFSRFYDLQVLEAAQRMWFNMLHLHGEEVMFDEVTDYPVEVINWHDRHTYPDLGTGLQHFKGTVCGGLSRSEMMVLGTPESVTAEALNAINATDGRRFILGTGCVLPIIAPLSNILAARSAVEVN
jgi:uroporphyrinogen decarboxylase